MPAHTTTYRSPIRRGRVAGLLLAAAALVAIASHGFPAASSSSSSAPPAIAVDLPVPDHRDHRLGQDDGAVPDGTTVFDDGVPGIANLDGDLLGALRAAAADAGREGITFEVDSGWRSPAYQERLLREAVAKYGSEQEAARWVAAPATSAHVSGGAVDLGPDAARSWLAANGARYGLCQIYRNEPWHFELRAQAGSLGCPRMYADASQDPELQQ